MRESAKKSLALFWLDFARFLFALWLNLLGASLNLGDFGFKFNGKKHFDSFKFRSNLKESSASQNLFVNFKFSNLACKRIKFVLPNLPEMRATDKEAQAKFTFFI